MSMASETVTGRERILLITYKMIRFAENIFRVFPIKKNRIIFQSFGHADSYSCNPKYVCEYLKEKTPGKFELIWAFQHPDQFRNLDGVISVKHKSLKWLFYLYTSKVIILNEGPSAFAAKRKGQYLIQTWHGGGAYKKVGFARGDITPLWKWIYETTGKDIDLFLAPSEVSAKTAAYETYHYTGEILKSGSPRNDILLDPIKRERTAKRVRELFSIGDRFLVLYAPTFRNTSDNLEGLFSFQKLLEAVSARTHKDAILMVRAHRYHSQSYKGDVNALDVTDYPDMQELLCAADMLITDYSSCMWDYALLKRPCLLYVPDLAEYDTERGFFTPITEWPGIICETADQLYQVASTFSEEFCAEKAEKHLQQLGSYEKGTASEQVYRRIIEIIE